MKFQVGDEVIVITECPNYSIYTGQVGLITKIHHSKALCTYAELDIETIGDLAPRFYERELELERIYNSPLMNALK